MPEISSPLVSVVIPTCNRSQIVPRAVNSALAQTLTNLEVIVIIDGSDPATQSTLAVILDSRLRVIALPTQRGGAGARNAGVAAAQGQWIAFLDDDDEWMPEKLEKQMTIATTAQTLYPVVACGMVVQTPRGKFAIPRRVPQPQEPISNYLFLRRSFFHGEGAFITSMLLTCRDLLLKVPFTEGLKVQQDVDWLLRACAIEDVHLYYSPEPLGIWHVDENRPRITTVSGWRQSLQWLQTCRQENLVTPAAYASFILTQINAQVAHEGHWKNFWFLLQVAHRQGQPNLISYLSFLSMWLIPQTPRRIIRDVFLARLSPAQSSPAGTLHNP